MTMEHVPDRIMEHVKGSNAGLGRIPSFDESSTSYLLRASPRRAQPLPLSKHWLSRGPVLDQGGTSQCVVYSTDKFLTTHPVVNLGFVTEGARSVIYKQVQKLDEWPGENYDGTSVLAMMKWLKQQGLVVEYRWAYDIQTLLAHVLLVGPVVVGTTWTTGMSMPDRWGYIQPDGAMLGGHAWVIIGASRNREHPTRKVNGAFRMMNSWGSNWGQKGRAWISFGDMEYLLNDYGEAAVPIEKKLQARIDEVMEPA